MWYCGNNETPGAKASGMELPNAWGLHDMHGNLWEWCQDWWHGDYTDAPQDGRAWELPAGASRVVRGGHWTLNAALCRSANRRRDNPDFRFFDIWFRLARTNTE